MLTLDILICTINQGVENVNKILLSPIEGVRYVVSWQQCGYSASVPMELLRDDVSVSVITERGLSRNRNNALSNAKADICLIADDDVRYKPEYIDIVRSTFADNPDVDMALFQYASEHEYKSYPDYSFNLKNMPKGYYVSSIEIAFRRKAVVGRIRFNELFGLGSPVLRAGEDGVFMLDAMKAGLNVVFFPKVVVVHDDPSTGVINIADKGVLMAKGAYIWLAYSGASAQLRYVINAWRAHKREPKVSFFTALRHIKNGAAYIRQHQ